MTPSATPFPWPAAMAFGLGVLRLPPETFWRMTPRELAAAIHGRRRPASGFVAPPDRTMLAALMTRFPDEVPHG